MSKLGSMARPDTKGAYYWRVTWRDAAGRWFWRRFGLLERYRAWGWFHAKRRVCDVVVIYEWRGKWFIVGRQFPT